MDSEELVELCEELLAYFNFADPDDTGGPVSLDIYTEGGELVNGVVDDNLFSILNQIKSIITDND